MRISDWSSDVCSSDLQWSVRRHDGTVLRKPSADPEMTQDLQAAAALLVLELVRHGTDDPRGNDPTAAADTDLDVGDLGFRIAEDGRRDDLAHQHQAQGAEIAQARVNVGPLRQFAAVGHVSDVAEIVLKSVHGLLRVA